MLTSRGVVFAAAAAALAVVAIAPIVVLMAAPAWDGRWDLYLSAILDARQIALLVNSVGISTGTAVVATGIGAPLGFLLARAPIRTINAIRLCLAVPVVIPTYALALSWILMAGGGGVATRFFGSEAVARLVYSPSGAVIVLAFALYPIPMLATEAAARRIETRLEEAAALIAPAARVLARVTLPLLWPAIIMSGLLTFVLALSDYAVPNLLRQRVFTTEVFTAFAALYDVGRATALAIPLLTSALVVGVVVTSTSASVLEVNRASSRAGIPVAHLGVIAALAIPLVLGIAVLFPLAVLAREAGSVETILQAIDRSDSAIGESILLASGAATLSVGLSLILGYRLGRVQRTVAHRLEAGLVALFAVPGTIVGVGLIDLWNRPGVFGLIYGTPLIVVIAYLARFIPAAILIIGAAVRRVPRSTEEAAAVAGAGWARTMRHVVVPQIGRSLVVAWVLVFVLAFGEVGASVLVAPAGHAPYPVHVFTLIANARSEQVAALAFVQALVVVCPFVVASALVLMRGRRHE